MGQREAKALALGLLAGVVLLIVVIQALAALNPYAWMYFILFFVVLPILMMVFPEKHGGLPRKKK